MGIERGHSATGAAAPAHTPAAAGKAAAQAAASGDFLALMAALDDGAGLGEALLPGAEPSIDAAAAEPEGERADEALGLPVAGWPWPTTPVPQPSPAAQAAGHVAAGAPTRSEPAASLGATPQGATAAEAPAAGPPPGAAQTVTASAAGAAPAPTAAPPELAAVFEQLRHRLAAQEAAPREPVPVPAASNAAPAAPAVVRELARAERAGPMGAVPMARGETVALQAQAVAAVAAGQGAAQTGDAPSNGSGGHAPGHGPWVQDFTPTVQYDATLAATEPVVPAEAPDPEAVLADQLRHWAASGPRSAELTLGGSEPVQMRIDLDGTEAQVQFRSEHAATRDMLASTVDQLRELLGAQGLTLAGVSVGAQGSGQGRDPQGQSPASPAPPRPGAADAATAAVPATPPAPRQGASALDLYV